MIYKLHPSLSEQELKHLANRFHFESKDLPELTALYKALLPLLDAKAYYEINCLSEPIEEENYYASLITLGQGIDDLTDLYLSHQQIGPAYMIDCIGLELLSKAYEEFVELLNSKASLSFGNQTEAPKLYVTKLSFLGDQYPLEYLKDFFQKLNPRDMSLTDSLFITPSKSASLILPLSKQKQSEAKDLCNSCVTCNNYSCPSRKASKLALPKTYGNMQIFNA